jgi:hypothetical protein
VPADVSALRVRLLTVAPLRAVLGSACLVGARALGSGSTPALLAFATGAVGFVIAILADPRRRMPAREPLPLPKDASFDSPVRAAVSALFPSTFGLTVLAALAAIKEPTLTAFLGGGIAGLGIAAALSLPEVVAEERRSGSRFYVGRKTQSLYRAVEPGDRSAESPSGLSARDSNRRS